MRRLRRLFSRAQPDRSEIDILRGILAAARRSADASRARAESDPGCRQSSEDADGDASA